MRIMMMRHSHYSPTVVTVTAANVSTLAATLTSGALAHPPSCLSHLELPLQKEVTLTVLLTPLASCHLHYASATARLMRWKESRWAEVRLTVFTIAAGPVRRAQCRLDASGAAAQRATTAGQEGLARLWQVRRKLGVPSADWTRVGRQHSGQRRLGRKGSRISGECDASWVRNGMGEGLVDGIGVRLPEGEEILRFIISIREHLELLSSSRSGLRARLRGYLWLGGETWFEDTELR
ncbi:hypothetical protein CVT25_005197 [Psilocybe cyanescens]|uniref:Uncharacterized protein n=1 Tax=Psilocybe cyanescens TaxID=93625 RepID=A0A409XE35_PSICY|nr:hypothetical protein CVT25_005197 [Psilocybe cyanescens]